MILLAPNASEAAALGGVPVVPVGSLAEAVGRLREGEIRFPEISILRPEDILKEA